MAIEVIDTGRFSQRVLGYNSRDFYLTNQDRFEIVQTGDGADTVLVQRNRGQVVGDTVFDQFVLRLPPDQVDTGDGDDRVLITASLGIIFGGDDDDVIRSVGSDLASQRGELLQIFGDNPSINDTRGHGNDTIFAGVVDELIDGGCCNQVEMSPCLQSRNVTESANGSKA